MASFAVAVPAQNADAGDRTVRAADALERALLAEVNQLRAQHGLRPLRLSTRLSAAADAHSRAMVAQGFFAHASNDGTAFWKRVQRWYGPRGYAYWAVGENLLWASPTVAPDQALRMWLESPPHRKNLLARKWREIGLSAVHATSAPGIFEGLDVTVVTADFGV
ncbi:MAG: CAP domain-containing protein, partial [Actinomycetota bacterium]|nr:CAP domain-containing protein [Actinomycetota bacterium]